MMGKTKAITPFKIGDRVRVHSKSSKHFGKFAKVTNVGRKKLTVDFGMYNYGYASKDCVHVEEYDTTGEDSDDPVEATTSPEKKQFVSPEKSYRVTRKEYLSMGPPSVGGYFGSSLDKMAKASGELIGEMDLSDSEVKDTFRMYCEVMSSACLQELEEIREVIKEEK